MAGRSAAPDSLAARRRRHNVDETILITGGAGFIGSHVAAELLARGQGAAPDLLTA